MSFFSIQKFKMSFERGYGLTSPFLANFCLSLGSEEISALKKKTAPPPLFHLVTVLKKIKESVCVCVGLLVLCMESPSANHIYFFFGLRELELLCFPMAVCYLFRLVY